MVTCDSISRYEVVIPHKISWSFTRSVTLLWPGVLILAQRKMMGRLPILRAAILSNINPAFLEYSRWIWGFLTLFWGEAQWLVCSTAVGAAGSQLSLLCQTNGHSGHS